MNVSKPEVPEGEAAEGKTYLSVKDASSAEFPKCYFRFVKICSVWPQEATCFRDGRGEGFFLRPTYGDC